MAPSLLQIQNLSVDFHTDEGRVRAVEDLNLCLQQGQVMGLVGESGSGKSLTAKTIMRLTPRNASIGSNSQVKFYHQDQWHDVLKLRGSQMRLVRGGAVSMIFQEPMASFAPAIRISDQIVQTMQIHLGVSEQEARKKGIELFERVGINQPAKRFDQYVYELSGGMRQRAMIAMALSTQPRLLIADEPTTALDVTIQAQVLDLMLELREQFGMAMIFITHDLGVVSKIADDVTVMKKGKLVEAGKCHRVLFQPEHGYTKRLLDALPHLENLPEPKTERTEPLVEVDNLRIDYSVSGRGRKKETFTAVHNMSLKLPKGEIIGLVGESGSGKTSFGKALLAASPISQGKVNFIGAKTKVSFDPRSKPKRHELAKVAQLVFQDPYSSLNPRMTVRDIIAEPLLAMKFTKSKAETDAKVIEIAKRCHIEVSHLRRFPHAFSGGQRQRISIARALICEPEFIVADESVAALDVSIQSEILKLLKELRDELGLTILFISHDLSVIANLCDWVCVMRHGELVEQGNVKTIFTNPNHVYTQKLIASIPILENPDTPRKTDLEQTIKEESAEEARL